MQATQLFVLSSISFCMFGHQKILVSAVILIASASQKCRVSSGFFLSSVGTTIRSTLNVCPHLLFSFSNNVRYWSGAVFFSSRLIASRFRLRSASVEDFAIKVFKSSIKLNSAILIVPSVLFLSPVIFSMTWFICMNWASFSSVLYAFKSTIGKLWPRIIWLSPSLFCSVSSIVSGCWASCSSPLRSSRGFYPPPNLFALDNNSPSISAISSRLLCSVLRELK